MVFIETPIFVRQVTALLSDEELRALQNHLMERPDTGVVISGGRGLRKMRWGLTGRGKRGGARVIYYWMNERDQILLLLMDAKNQQEDLSSEQIRVLSALVEEELQ